MKKKISLIIATAICIAAIAAAGYKINQNTEKNIYPVGKFKSANYTDNFGNYKEVSIEQQQVDTILNILKNSDNKKIANMDFIKENHELNIYFEMSAVHFYIDDNTNELYYVIQKRTKDGEAYYIKSEELLNYIKKVVK